LRFGAVVRAETNDDVVESEANLNLMFTHSRDVHVAIAVDSWFIKCFGFSWVR